MRSIDPSEVFVRHVVRGNEGDLYAKQIGLVYFVREEAISGADGLNGRQGWQAGETTLALSDDGSFTLQLPNTAGDDGVLHRRRFKFFTDDFYEPGEEWLEFVRDPDDVIFVGTPTDGEKTPSTVTIKGVDLNVVLAGSLSSDVDVWDATAPADVLHHYSRLSVLAHGEDSAGTITGSTAEYGAPHTASVSGMSTDCWTAETQLRWTEAKPTTFGNGKLALNIGRISLQVDVSDGSSSLVDLESGVAVAGKRQGLIVPGPVAMRIVTFYDHVFGFVAGELVAELRRDFAWPAVGGVEIFAAGGTVVIDGLKVTTLLDFARAAVERNLPGILPPTGLRAQFWNAAGIYAQHAETPDRLARLWALTGDDPAVERVDSTVHFAPAGAFSAPNMPGAYAVRWSGAIYLDLAATDRTVRLASLVGNARLYIGKTLRGEEAASSWASSTSTITTSGLRAFLGTSEAGWYPIVIEQTYEGSELRAALEDQAVGGSYAVVPQSRLSPLGVYSDVVRYANHRQVFGDVAGSFGYQWRTEPRAFESGAFPGQIVAKALVGRMTDIVIDDHDVGSEAQVSSSATDVVDGLTADAAGVADPKGSGQLSAQVVDYSRDHLALRQGYESLSDITEPPLLQTRLDSLLALRSSPNEQVGVRPKGQRDLVDTFPLTGALARMDWLPGDAARLRLESIDVLDDSPRQLTTVTWPLKRDGIGAPVVGFRQRPRSVKAAMKRLAAAIYSPRRNYQGSIAVLTGSVGGEGGVDEYSRAPLPTDLRTIVKAVVVVGKVGAGWRLEVGGVDLSTAGSVPSAGRYDITDSLKAVATSAPQAKVRLIAGSGTYELTLEVFITV